MALPWILVGAAAGVVGKALYDTLTENNDDGEEKESSEKKQIQHERDKLKQQFNETVNSYKDKLKDNLSMIMNISDVQAEIDIDNFVNRPLHDWEIFNKPECSLLSLDSLETLIEDVHSPYVSNLALFDALGFLFRYYQIDYSAKDVLLDYNQQRSELEEMKDELDGMESICESDIDELENNFR